ncbi:imidazole glycerol phosphate synthase subunit HisF [Candidatus Woesearchaeota archaeon]|nr:imidazole glycerol phosphate synthase subunit HisF [Candidatus Woesearchaeota archaeon]
MLTKRIIPCLDVRWGGADGKTSMVVKGINFRSIHEVGNPVKMARQYYEQGADELVFLDIDATNDRRRAMIKVISEVAKQIFIPFTVGGGIRTLDDIDAFLRAGADKISINSAAVNNPSLIKIAAERYGSQCIVIAIDAKRKIHLSKNAPTSCTDSSRTYASKLGAKLTLDSSISWTVSINGGNKDTGIDVLGWARKAQRLGAGELLVTSMDKDGTSTGYDLELLKLLTKEVSVPVIASGGAGSVDDIAQAFITGNADAALAASIFHLENMTVWDVKNELIRKRICINQ